MSLFKARDWWSTFCGSEEEFDKGCLCVANIDNNAESSDKIIVGSHSGVLRIFNPHPVKKEDGTYSNFRPDELLLEGQLNYPIIQIASGHLVSSSSLLHLAVLHPLKLSVYLISAIQGAVDHGTHYHLSLAYEHNLQRTACNLVIGPFGGTQGKDLMCVQSLDGTLTFFEQESFAFSRFLPNFLLPGPLVYITKTDSFVTVSGFSAESYRFQVLAVAKDCDSRDNEEELENFKGKRVTLDWSYNLGEPVLDIAVVESKHQSSTILILGEKTLFVLNSNGVLKYTKKLDYNPSCFLSYKDVTSESLTVLIVTFTQTLLVYQDTQLKWAAQLPFCPICIQKATFAELNGILVILSGEGSISCCYLGTDPSLFVSPVAEAREIDFEEAEQEMLKLRKLIKSSNNVFPGAQRLGSEIIISIIIPQNLDPLASEGSTAGNLIFHENFGPVPSMTVKLQLKCTTAVHDVRLMIHVEPPLRVSQSVFTFGSLLDYSQAVVTVFMESPYLPSSLKLIALAAYTNSHGGPRIAESSSLLPLHLVTKPCLPSKIANYRITIDINKKTIPVSDLFSDFVGDSAAITGGALGIEYYGNQQVTVLPSKTSQRYRIQSDYFSALWLVTSEVVKRLYRRYKKDDSNSDFKCSYSSSLPLQEYFSIIDEHFECRQARNQVEDLLSHRAEQFRAVQKRLLTKLKDKTPTPLNNLDTLLEATHRHIMSIAETLEKNIEAVEASSCSLSCATRLMLFLLQLSTGLKDKEISFIEACFSPYVDFESKQGWEERIDISLTFLLKSCLGKTGNNTNIADSLLNMPRDLAKLKKHLTLAFDKVIKNDYHMVNATNENGELKDNAKDSESHQGEDTIIPVGSKFGERKSARGEKKHIFSENQSKTIF